MLEVKNVRMKYGSIEALKGVSLKTENRSVVSVVGANGAGKSTLLRAISGLLRPDSGEIWFDGVRIDHLSPREIVRLGLSYSPERAPIFPQMSVMDNILVGGYLLSRKELRKRLGEVFEIFPILRERRNQEARTLSGGERQMLSIARVMMPNPKMIMLDEPSLGLAPLVVEGLGAVILQISARNVQILLVEQNFWLSHRLSKWLYVMELGQFELQGPPEEVEQSERLQRAYLG
jgi:branched-chain amino acid transport system ATP-binding protein